MTRQDVIECAMSAHEDSWPNEGHELILNGLHAMTDDEFAEFLDIMRLPGDAKCAFPPLPDPADPDRQSVRCTIHFS